MPRFGKRVVVNGLIAFLIYSYFAAFFRQLLTCFFCFIFFIYFPFIYIMPSSKLLNPHYYKKLIISIAWAATTTSFCGKSKCQCAAPMHVSLVEYVREADTARSRSLFCFMVLNIYYWKEVFIIMTKVSNKHVKVAHMSSV